MWVEDAWTDIQASQPNWIFQTVQDTTNITSGNRTLLVSAISPGAVAVVPMVIGRYRCMKMYKTSTGVSDEQLLYFMPYEHWRGTWDLGSRPSGRPAYWTIRPGNVIEVDPTPDDTYTLVMDIKRAAQVLAADADDPAAYPSSGQGLPAEYHDVIVWKACVSYAQTRGDPRLSLFQSNYDAAYTRMCNAFLPRLIL